jgi:hypothetical protein
MENENFQILSKAELKDINIINNYLTKDGTKYNFYIYKLFHQIFLF